MMKRTLILTILMLTVVGIRHSFAGGTVNLFTLPNGLKVLHKEVTHNPLVTAQLFLRAGTAAESESQAGLAHFTQSLMMQGTATRDAETIARESEDIGASLSSDIEHDYVTFGISLMDTHLDKGMELLSDIALHPSFPADEIEKERTNTLAGIRSRQDQIFSVANDLFSASFYGNHPYSWPDIGKKETVEKFTREDAVNWHRTQYVGKNMLLVIVGNVSRDRAKALAEKYFSKTPAGEPGKVAAPVKPPCHDELQRSSKKFQQAYIMIGFPAPKIGAPDYPALKVLNGLLGGRMSGRLFVELREKLSLAYEVNSFYPSRTQTSRFVVYMGLEKKNLELARKRIMEILQDLKTTPVPDKELQETKNYIRGVYLLDHQTIGRQAWHIGWWEVLGAGYAYDDQYIKDLDAVTVQDIENVAKKYFTDCFVQVQILPEGK